MMMTGDHIFWQALAESAGYHQPKVQLKVTVTLCENLSTSIWWQATLSGFTCQARIYEENSLEVVGGFIQ